MPLLRPLKSSKTDKKSSNSSKKGEKSKSSKSKNNTSSKKSPKMTTRSSSRVTKPTPLIKSTKSSKKENNSTKKREAKRPLASSDSSIEISLPIDSSHSKASSSRSRSRSSSRSSSSSNNSTPKLAPKKVRIEKDSPKKSPKKSPKNSPSPKSSKQLSPHNRTITGTSSKLIQQARHVLNQVKQQNGLSQLPEAVVIESAVFNPRIAHRKRTAWSTKETRDLMKGVERHGEGKWALILHDKTLHFHHTRTAVDLKDKYRNMTQYVEYKNRPMRKFVLVDSRHQPILSAAGGQTILNNR